ncbi:hypothetical protein ABPG75_013050 [Micractinium tetrahymenae]
MSARRTSLTAASRRRSTGSTQRLGAVKLHSPLGAGPGSDAGSPASASGSEPASALATPQERSPLVTACRGTEQPSRASSSGLDAGHVAAPPALAGAVAQFSRQLTTSRSADRWLEEQTAAAAKGPPRRQQSLPGTAQQQQAQAQQKGAAVVESAASQIVHKALRFITADSAAAAEAPRKPDATFDSQSFLDKGMDAIGSVGRLMEGFAITLDTVIGQAFEDWGTQPQMGPKQALAGRPMPAAGRSSAVAAAGKENAGAQAPAGKDPAALRAAAGAAATATKPRQQQEQQGASGGAGNVSASTSARQAHITSFMSKLDAVSEQEAAEWRKRAQQLASELQRMRAQQEEYQRLRLQYEKLQSDLQQASCQASQLARENSALKSRSLPPEVDPALADPLAAQQVARQMEALLREKSKLVAENDRLLRENTGLQELLEFSLAHQAQLAADGDLFDYEEDECGGVVAAESEALAVAGSPSPAGLAVAAGEAALPTASGVA